jgi:hypothetical protein
VHTVSPARVLRPIGLVIDRVVSWVPRIPRVPVARVHAVCYG